MTCLSCQDKLVIEPNYFSIPFSTFSFVGNDLLITEKCQECTSSLKVYQNRNINNHNIRKDSFSILYQNSSSAGIWGIGIYNIPLRIGKYKIIGYELDSSSRPIYSNTKTVGSMGGYDSDSNVLFTFNIDSNLTNSYIEIMRYDSVNMIVEGNFSADFKIERRDTSIVINSSFTVRNGMFKATLL
jgi:hypothetical protein